MGNSLVKTEHPGEALRGTWPVLNKHLTNIWNQNLAAMTVLLPAAIITPGNLLPAVPILAGAFSLYADRRVKRISRAFNQYAQEYQTYLDAQPDFENRKSFLLKKVEQIGKKLNSYRDASAEEIIGGATMFYLSYPFLSSISVDLIPYVGDAVNKIADDSHQMAAVFSYGVLYSSRHRLQSHAKRLHHLYRQPKDEQPEQPELKAE